MRKEEIKDGKIITKCGTKHNDKRVNKKDEYTVVKRSYNRVKKPTCTACEQ